MTAPCPSGKVRHASPQRAHAALAHQGRRKGRRDQARDNAYACTDCGGWHVRSGRPGGTPRGRRR